MCPLYGNAKSPAILGTVSISVKSSSVRWYGLSPFPTVKTFGVADCLGDEVALGGGGDTKIGVEIELLIIL